jgi:hypothetical protein
MAWFDTVPLIVAGPVILLLLLGGVELGYRGHSWLMADRVAGHGGPDQLLAAVLGLLALLLGFTFSLALNRYETRRDFVLQEANAIGTTWLRAQLLEEPNRAAMSGLLRVYVDARLKWSQADDRDDLTATDAIQQNLWRQVGVAIRTDPSAQLSRGLMDAMNDSFDLASARVAMRQAHIPDRVLAILLLYAFLSAVMLGYILSANGRPHRIATAMLLALMTLALIVILDLDRPRTGAILVSQQPMIDLKASLR